MVLEEVGDANDANDDDDDDDEEEEDGVDGEVEAEVDATRVLPNISIDPCEEVSADRRTRGRQTASKTSSMSREWHASKVKSNECVWRPPILIDDDVDDEDDGDVGVDVDVDELGV